MFDDIISVIVPIYNMERYLQKCIDSIVNQTYSNLEIILVNDGSTDSSSKICDMNEKKDNRIHAIHMQNQGVGSARNAGIDFATGKYILFVDPDDYLPNDSIELLYNGIQENDSDMSIGTFVKVYDDGTKSLPYNNWYRRTIIEKNEALELLGSVDNPISTSVWAKLYRNTVFKNIRFSSLTSGEDTEIMPKIISNCNTISIIPNVVYFYYQRITSVIHNKTDIRQMDSLASVLSVGRFLLDKGFIESAKHYYRGAVIIIANMDAPKEGRQLFKNTYSKEDTKVFHNKGWLFYLAWIGMYIPHFYHNTVAIGRKIKKYVK